MEYDVAIVGGGCIGCSVAKHLAEKSDLDICILEKEYFLAQHQSGRNSGVLHPGFNYPPGSLKAQYATKGTTRLKEFASTHDIPLEEFGVVVVANTEREETHLRQLREWARENGVKANLIGRSKLEELEPHANGQHALHCPEAASIDPQKYVYALATVVENLGVDIHLGHRVESLTNRNATFEIQTTSGHFQANYLVNAAGLYADRLAHQVGVGEDYQIIPFRGEYYELVPQKRHFCRSMIYPTPDPELPFLGVHFTRRTDGRVIVGPNAVLAFGREAYNNTDVNLNELSSTLKYPGFWNLFRDKKLMRIAWEEFNKSYRKSKFVEASQKLIPEVEPADFTRSYAGNRAQLVTSNGQLVKEPVFLDGPDSLHILNAVSPGLTSSLPFGEHMAERVLEEMTG